MDDSSSATENTSESSTRSRGSMPESVLNRKGMNGNGYSENNGATNGNSAGTPGKASGARKGRVVDGWLEGSDPRVDKSGKFEFGGSVGVTLMMIGFPLLMWYMWIGATYYNGKFPTREEGQSHIDFVRHLGMLMYEGAFPTLQAWVIYWVFFVFEMACYCLLPGIWSYGKPLPHEGDRRLKYWCSGVWSFYITILVVGALHFTGVFPLYTILDQFGPVMSVSIISGYLVSFIAYFSALYRGAEHRMTGYPIYDFFMGAELNPRMFGILDFKMFFEVRIPWYILFLISCAAAARQYEQFGYVSGEVWFLVMAHFLYANACSKGEECIVSTWYFKDSLLSRLRLISI
jgi:Delta24(24(1))-sterol reductase